jgi:hypothetical protein
LFQARECLRHSRAPGWGAGEMTVVVRTQEARGSQREQDVPLGVSLGRVAAPGMHVHRVTF